MPETVYMVEYTTRAHSSGYENKVSRVFYEIEEASEYMLEVFEKYGLDEDPEDLFVNEDMEEQAPRPTMELAALLFSPESLKAFLALTKDTFRNTIYGPYSEFCCLVPFEISFTSEEID